MFRSTYEVAMDDARARSELLVRVLDSVQRTPIRYTHWRKSPRPTHFLSTEIPDPQQSWGFNSKIIWEALRDPLETAGWELLETQSHYPNFEYAGHEGRILVFIRPLGPPPAPPTLRSKLWAWLNRPI